MENKGLLFIPDISGFSRFVNKTEIEHSRLIIQELLEKLINANQIGLEVSEIEGDAILFYKFGEPPRMEEVYNQVEKMFCDFHKSLIAYENSRYCQCYACGSAIDLTLKVITHYGEFTGYSVKNFHKLIGKDIIVAHQLLKNDIEQHEYWLVTKNLFRDDPPSGYAQWMKWNSSAKQTESGEVVFHFTQLSPLKELIAPEPIPQLETTDYTKVISVSRDYKKDIITLFHASGDFNHRSSWRDGVKKVEEIDPFLPRVGMSCRCIMDDGQVIIYSSSYNFQPDRIQFSETNEADKSVTNYVLEKISEDSSRLTLEYYVKKKFPSSLLFNLFRKRKEEESFKKSLVNLDELVRTIRY